MTFADFLVQDMPEGCLGPGGGGGAPRSKRKWAQNPELLILRPHPRFQHFAHGCTQAANSWTSEQEGCLPVADTGLADTFPGLGR